MAQKLTASLPDGLDLDQSYSVLFTAIDATTGDLIAGVNVSNASLIVHNVSGGNLESGPFTVVPLFTPVDLDAQDAILGIVP